METTPSATKLAHVKNQRAGEAGAEGTIAQPDSARSGGPWRKLERGYSHLEALDSSIRSYLHSENFAITTRDDPVARCRTWTVDNPPQPPLEWALAVGDVLYNFRAALDYLAWTLVLANGKQPDSRNAFPVFLNPKGFKATAKTRGMSSDAKKALLNVQPFARSPTQPETNRLWLLNRLSNIDKHRHLHLLLYIVGGSELRSVPLEAIRWIHQGPLKATTRLVEIELRPDTKAAEFAPQFSVAFADDSPKGVRRNSVRYFLKSLFQDISGILFSFQDLASDGSRLEPSRSWPPLT
jgi:hypothetical protein